MKLLFPTLISIVDKRLGDLPQQVGTHVAEVVGVDHPYHMAELVHPRLRGEGSFIPI